MNDVTFQVGPIRPPSEANSLLLRVTQNCPWNKCKFCMLYKDTKFYTRTVEELKKEVDLLAEYRDFIMGDNGDILPINKIQKKYDELPSFDEKQCFHMVFRWATEGNCQGIFLQDANTLVLKTEWLAEIVAYVKEKFPELKRITSYGRANTLANISEDGFRMLAEAGLNRIHSGYESGSEKVLSMIGKGGTQEDEIIGGKKVRDAGIQLSIYFMPGVGGKEFSLENAEDTAYVINEVNPDFVRLRTFVLRTGSLMEDLKTTHNYVECTDMEKLLEIRQMLEKVDPKKVTGTLKSDHIINLLEGVEGNLSTDLDYMKNHIDGFLQMHPQEQKMYQLARRIGYRINWNELSRIPDHELDKIRQTSATVQGAEWERLLHRYTDQYI